MSTELEEYIEKQRAKGASDEEIYNKLKKAGWSESDIDLHTIDPDDSPPIIEQPIIVE